MELFSIRIQRTFQLVSTLFEVAHSVISSILNEADGWREMLNSVAFIIAGSKKPPIFVSLTIIRLQVQSLLSDKKAYSRRCISSVIQSGMQMQNFIPENDSRKSLRISEVWYISVVFSWDSKKATESAIFYCTKLHIFADST